MIALRIEVIEYNKDTNTCSARLLNGDVIKLDPFVSCAIPLTDEQYENGEGAKIVGRCFILTEYTVYKNQVVPLTGGMIDITCDDSH